MEGLDRTAASRLVEDRSVRPILDLLNRDGEEARIVGGAVRNALIGRDASDIDIATTLAPEAVMRLARDAGLKAAPTGVEHGTVTLVAEGRGHEVTTLRRDVETDGRRAVVAFTRSFAEDAARRDFTINQLSVSRDGALHDYAGGLADLAERRVRFIGEAEQRIREDYLRILRFFRFSAEYAEGALDPAGLAACAALAPGMARLSRERVWTELKKLLGAKRAHEALASMIDRGIWAAMCGLPPDLAAFAAAAAIWPEADAMTRLAALLVRREGDAAALDREMRLSNAERRRLEEAEQARGRLLADGPPGAENVRRAAFRTSARGALDGLATLASGLNRAQARAWAAQTAPVSPWRGADLLRLGVPAGPAVGTALAEAEAEWERLGFPDDPSRQRAILEAAAMKKPPA